MSGMKVFDWFLQKVSSKEEIDRDFQLDKRVDINMSGNDRCVNCGDNQNKYSLPSDSWTDISVCLRCERILFTVYSDRMSGVNSDTVFVYKQKEV